MVERLLYTIENRGVVLELDNVVPKKFFKKMGRKGFGVAPTELVTRKGAKGGSRWRRTIRRSRRITLPIRHVGSDRAAIEDQMRLMIRTLNDEKESPRLYAKYPDGSRKWVEIHYEGGADPEYGVDTDGQTYADWGLSLFAPKSYWTSETAVSYNLTSANIGRGLIKLTAGIDDLSKLRISSSQTIGNIVIENPGDVETQPVWTIRGPGDGFVAVRSDGQRFEYNAAIAPGSTIKIDTVNATVEDELGNNMYGNLGDAPKFFTIPSGGEVVYIVMEGTDSNSLVSINFNPRWELIF